MDEPPPASNHSEASAAADPFEQFQNDMTFAKGFMTIVYMIVFVIGTPGNIWIIYKLLRTGLWSKTGGQLTVSQRSRIYIFALACSDQILLLTLPATSSYNYYGTWKFGSLACYSIRSVEIFAKLFSVVLLTVMSLERYIIVCTKLRHIYQAWMSLVPLALGTLFGVVLPTTIHFCYLQHFRFDMFGEEVDVPAEEPETWLCLPNMTDRIFNAFAQYTFLVGFIVPFVIMTICYILLVRHVKRKYKLRRALSPAASAKSSKEPRYMSEVRKSIWRIAVFHFVCWAPFWGFTMLPHYISWWAPTSPEAPSTAAPTESDMNDMVEPLWFVYCRLFANCLPYINAAGNWVLYALLNVDVRKHIYNQPKKKRRFTIKFKPSIIIRLIIN
ncbi:unnamed protein product [Caenorhabditis auriculariae]|uniref:G-protein coupled receptors family 1 profile domain-containing protein n=1 Tax=Caenorhabditis auriculariae TaxID=2777116 RepID=A0A8S1HLD3_9PELO|nr:unnamed protein product [Caenorhabditis auriculariae]